MWFANVNSLNEDIMICVSWMYYADVDTLYDEIVDCVMC
jgi:hypothetical protein